VTVTDNPEERERHLLDRDVYPPGVPCWVDTEQAEPDAAIAFYGELFGWEFERRTPAGSPEQYFIARLRGRTVAGIRSLRPSAPPTPVWTTYICTDSADDAATRVRHAGGSVLAEPFDVPHAGRGAVVADRSDAVFGLWQPNERKGAELVNEPGAWNFSGLNTPNPQGAREFYGAVFGWELSSFGPDGDGGGFWRMPGYGDFLEQRNPGMRAGMKEMGAPEGFEDAVATLAPTSDQVTDDTRPHWDITFAVENADATAERAEQLGAIVLAPPADAPWVRTTILRDPRGTVFTASQFVPPTS
jgi:predicted enzyme related to lactoylglutathione lyase